MVNKSSDQHLFTISNSICWDRAFKSTAGYFAWFCKYSAYFIGLSLLLLTGCVSGPGALERNRPGPSRDGSTEGIEQSLTDFVDDEIGANGICQDNDLVKRSQRVTERIGRWGLGKSGKNLPKSKIIDSSRVFGFFSPAGQMILYRGLLELTEDSEEQTATVVAHLFAHAEAGQVRQRYNRFVSQSESEKNRQALAVAACSGLEPDTGSVMPFDNSEEKIADQLTVLYLTRAGYDPRAAIEWWSGIADNNGQSDCLFLRIHPFTSERRHNLRSYIQKARQ